jgi:profilin
MLWLYDFLLLFFQVSKEEIAKLVQGFEKQDILTSSGVTLAGNRYIYLSGTDRVIRAKLGKVGVHCMKTQQGRFVGCFIFRA